MNASRMTFGEHLMQFALSVDFIDPNCYELVQQLINKYLKLQLGARQIGLFEAHVVSNQPGMSTVWSDPTLRVSECLKDAHGQYMRQLGLSLGEVRNLWVVSRKNEALSPGNPGIDYWEEGRPVRKLPPFSVSPAGSGCRTAIYMTTRDAGDRPNGTVLVELTNPMRPTQALRSELQLLVDAVGLLHATDAGTREQRDGTNRAIDRLGDLVRQLELDPDPRAGLACGAVRPVQRAAGHRGERRCRWVPGLPVQGGPARPAGRAVRCPHGRAATRRLGR